MKYEKEAKKGFHTDLCLQIIKHTCPVTQITNDGI
jgi:hypothetical protein